jgi:3-phenylpropionate/trans-cinnamate dioxygenase ferredoxin reductase component
MTRGIVIVGGGLAAQRCCERLRRDGWDGPIRIVCAEPHPPYDRPPLSKAALAAPAAPPAFRPDDWYAEHDVDLLLASRAGELDISARRVRLTSGKTVPYEQLLVATGADPVVPPLLTGYGNVHTLRDFEDAVALRAALGPGRRLAVVGAGFLGLEAAATARTIGTEVELIDIAPVPLSRVVPNEVGRWFEAVHREQGVNMHLGDGVAGVETNAGEILALSLTSGEIVPCDVVLVAVGVRPSTGWLGVDGALATDSAGRTVLPGVFAAGDAAAWPDPATGTPAWSQQWEAAAREGTAVAKAMLGLPGPRPATAFFWTDQFGIRVQQLGTHRDADTTTLDGDPDRRDFAITWRRDNRVIGGLLVDRPRELGSLRKLIEHHRDGKGGDYELQSLDR